MDYREQKPLQSQTIYFHKGEYLCGVMAIGRIEVKKPSAQYMNYHFPEIFIEMTYYIMLFLRELVGGFAQMDAPFLPGQVKMK